MYWQINETFSSFSEAQCQVESLGKPSYAKQQWSYVFNKVSEVELGGKVEFENANF